MEFPVNRYVAIRQSTHCANSLGIFATMPITKGFRILEDPPLIMHNTREDAMEETPDEAFKALSTGDQQLLVRMYAGPHDIAPLLPAGDIRDQALQSTERLKGIIRFDAVKGRGTGCVVCMPGAFINHSCDANCCLHDQPFGPIWNGAKDAAVTS
ncbi:Uu.00g098730.m01.CDS01 [Anthostomella pinea]|uniref:Uu.00g098730.m01.CDS01 n=1 Tax=Anthostomella pinea TaxID=933095 RepID=A0AAI8VCI6_9PEZI|nr:Uu.00g098730.m01.CDS01 [Anthostomella pinea]